jgi:C-terminal processing protease CtpA/Prc
VWRGRPVAAWPEARADTADLVRIRAVPAVGPSAASYPARGYRVLAAARLWSTMHWFFPYMREAGESWDAAFRLEEPRIEAAADSLAYAKAIARLAWHLHDSHVRVYGRVLWRDFYGEVPASAVVQFIERRLLVTRIADPAAARAGLAVGDEVLSVDDESVPTRVARLSPYFVSSTPQALRTRLTDFVLAGPDTTPARLLVRGADGRRRRVAIPRSRDYPAPSDQTFRDGPVVRILPGNVGYVDLERLTIPMVDSTLAALAGTQGVVLDGRGYPTTPAPWLLMQHLHDGTSSPPAAARFEEFALASPDVASRSARRFTQNVFPAKPPRYAGRTALLLDERAISQAEHLGLHFRAANGTLFVGSPTMGANGGVTSVQLPGGLRVSFTGIRVTHPDGRPLQRVGLRPDVAVRPTVVGIRAGRDEVLERAVACLLDAACRATESASSGGNGPARP